MRRRRSFFDTFLSGTFFVTFGFGLLVTNPNKVSAYVTSENGFVILKTRESGTFVGLKEDFASRTRSGVTHGGDTYLVATNDSTTSSKSFYAFRGIPYAKPPIGSLRWKDPESSDVTSGPKDVTRFKSNCPQWNSITNQPIGNLDCLYLNIFTPRLHFSVGRGQGQEQSPYDDDPRKSVRSLPVLVYVHSGHYVTGSGDITHYEQFLEENTVLVTFNFRLGVFGFLTSGDSVLPGNLGLLDQIACLKWIRKNIHRFGGDPNRMTLFGEVSALMMSPLTADLFQALILMESPDSVFSPGHSRSRSTEFYRQFLISTRCASEETRSIDDCLHVRTVDELMQTQTRILRAETFQGLLGPLEQSGSEVLPVTPVDLSRSSTLVNGTIPIMFGVDAAEGFWSYYIFYSQYMKEKTVLNVEQLKTNLLHSLASKFPTISRTAVEEVWQFYFQNITATHIENTASLNHIFMQLFSDVSVYNSHWDLSQALSKRDATTFSYVFEHNLNKIEDFLKTENLQQNELPWEEEYFLFQKFRHQNQNDSNGDLNPSDLKMAKLLVKIWTSFASYSTPKSAIAKEKSWGKWTHLTKGSSEYFHLMLQGSKMKNNLKQTESEFWKTVLSKEYPEDEVRSLDISKSKPTDTAKSNYPTEEGYNGDTPSTRADSDASSSYSSTSACSAVSIFNYLIVSFIYVIVKH